MIKYCYCFLRLLKLTPLFCLYACCMFCYYQGSITARRVTYVMLTPPASTYKLHIHASVTSVSKVMDDYVQVRFTYNINKQRKQNIKNRMLIMSLYNIMNHFNECLLFLLYYISSLCSKNQYKNFLFL
jgi:hypothetical protein